MSADRQRLKNAIRSIALTPEERRKLLGEGKNKGDQPASASRAQSGAQEASICCDGSLSGNANPGVWTREPDGDGAGQNGGLDADDPARLDMSGGTLSGVTDCATGQPVCFDGPGFVPPDGWNDLYEPPMKDGYEEGYYWIIGCQVFFSVNAYPSEGCWLTEGEAQSAAEAFCEQTDSPGVALKRGCATGTPSDPSCCNPSEEELLEDTWPYDGCTNLIVKDGQIVGSKYDPENDGSYSAPRDSIDLCDASNGTQITLRPSADGGWKTIDAINGGDGYLYKPNGERIARRIRASEFNDPDL